MLSAALPVPAHADVLVSLTAATSVSLSLMGFRNESCVKIGSENVVLGMFAPSCHVALEDVHFTFSNLEYAFLASVFASSSGRVMTEGITPFLATHVTNLQLCETLLSSTVMLTDRKIAECVKDELQAQEK